MGEVVTHQLFKSQSKLLSASSRVSLARWLSGWLIFYPIFPGDERVVQPPLSLRAMEKKVLFFDLKKEAKDFKFAPMRRSINLIKSNTYFLRFSQLYVLTALAAPDSL